MFVFYPEGVCSQMIEIELDGDTVEEVIFTGGCNGNLKAISKMIKGKKVDEIIEMLDGITCGFRKTSCTDQLCIALRQAVKENSEEGSTK
ncbi:MAG: TIGR03905 family TSCPD domain-containing protein [Clostridiales bacterium]|nr:TIGR03905 family TSCPD domain-containing protein [Clostridiales bacterium]